MREENLINPRALRVARKRRNMTQEKLAEAIKCTKDTVSRWERGTSRRVRSRHRDSLCTVLRVDWKEISGATDSDAPNPGPEPGKTKVTINTNLRNFLQLVALRYRISLHDVIILAPLLLVIVAEQSLLWRRKRLEQIDSTLTGMEEELTLLSKGLGNVAVRWEDFKDSLLEEEESLKKGDVFGQFISVRNLLWAGGTDPTDDHGPFIEFILEIMKSLPKEAVMDVYSWDDYMIDDYMIATDTIKSVIGLSLNGEENMDFLLWKRIFVHGSVDLRQCIRERRERGEQGFREWLTDLDRKETEFESENNPPQLTELEINTFW